MRIEFKLKNGKDYVFASDSHGYQVGQEVEVKRERGVEVNLTNVSYYSTIENALKGIYELGMRKSDAASWLDLAKDSEAISKMILGWRSVLIGETKS